MSSRPSEAEVDEALEVVRELVAYAGGCSGAGDGDVVDDGLAAHNVLYYATRPRILWPSKEVAEALGIEDRNVLRTGGLPAPVQVLPRPTAKDPGRVLRLWDSEQVLAFAAVRRERMGR